MKKIHASFFLLFFFLNISAQEDVVKQQILNYKDSEYDFVNKGRRLLADYLKDFKAEDAVKVRKSLLNEFDGKVSEVFYIGEYIHLLFWTTEFEELLNYLKQVDFNEPVSNNVATSAQTDNLFSSLFQHTSQFSDVIELDIKNAELSDMDRDFLLLLLKDMAVIIPSNERETSPHTSEINEMADIFLANYLGSPYESIVREQIRLVYKESDHGMYIDFSLGPILTQGNLQKTMGNGFGMDILFEYRHRKLTGMFGFGFYGLTLNEDVPVNETIWKKDAGATSAHLYLNAGYLAFENHRWSIYPFAGAGYTGFSAAEDDIKEDDRLDKLGIHSFFTQAGVGIDLKIKSLRDYNYNSPYPSTDSRISLKYTFRAPRLGRKNDYFDGAMHLVSLSYGFGGRSKERDL